MVVKKLLSLGGPTLKKIKILKDHCSEHIEIIITDHHSSLYLLQAESRLKEGTLLKNLSPGPNSKNKNCSF